MVPSPPFHNYTFGGDISDPKLPFQKWPNRISAVFVPCAGLRIAIASVIICWLLGYPFDFALSIGIAVLVISCPRAYILPLLLPLVETSKLIELYRYLTG